MTDQGEEGLYERWTEVAMLAAKFVSQMDERMGRSGSWYVEVIEENSTMGDCVPSLQQTLPTRSITIRLRESAIP